MSVGLLLADDYLFISRVQGHARAAGLDVKPVRKPTELVERARDLRPACVLIDLHVDGLDIAATVSGLRQLETPPRVIGYGSHVDVATLKKARDAGCDLVLPRSKFVDDLATELPAWFDKKDN
jgi:CheY-like chemotaxis protein